MLAIKRSFIFLFIVCIIFLLTGCSSSALRQRDCYLTAYHQSQLSLAEENLDRLMGEELSKGDYTRSKEATWLLLDRATTRFANGKVDAAIEDYRQAIESLDYYSQDLETETLAKLLLEDGIGAYQADDFEQTLARLYFAFALLHQGDETNAYALLRQAEDYQQRKREAYRKIPFAQDYCLVDNGLAKYLFALLLEKRGDRANAAILYRQAYELMPIKAEEAADSCQTNSQATVLVVCHNGKAPYKVSGSSPASVASLAALEVLLATKRVEPSWSNLPGIPVPILKQWPDATPSPTYAIIDGISKPLLPFYSVAGIAEAELKQKTPTIVARGVARALMRRGAVGYVKKKQPSLSAAFDLAMCIINHRTEADTRSWTTLPGFIDAARFDLRPGTHALNIGIYPFNYPSFTHSYALRLRPRDLCIIHVFNIKPGISVVLIPHRHLIPNGEHL